MRAAAWLLLLLDGEIERALPLAAVRALEALKAAARGWTEPIHSPIATTLQPHSWLSDI